MTKMERAIGSLCGIEQIHDPGCRKISISGKSLCDSICHLTIWPEFYLIKMLECRFCVAYWLSIIFFHRIDNVFG